MPNPDLILKPIAEDSTTLVIPPVDPATAGFGRMSQSEGYPPETEEPLETGGKAPQRDDMNGVLNLITQHTVFLQSGGMYLFNPALTYNIGCIIVKNDLITQVRSTVDGNTGDPNVSMTGWAAVIPAAVPNATESVIGITRFATPAETISSNRSTAITPFGLQSVTQTHAQDETPLRYLMNGAWGLGGKAPEIEIDDLNAAMVGGTYSYTASTLHRPDILSASGTGVILHVERSFGNLAYQEAREGSDKLFFRFRTGDFATGEWSIWKFIWNSNNLTKQSSNGDSASGRVLTVGAFGLGGQGLEIADGADLNTFLLGGFYRINNTPVNGPPGVLFSPMLVIRSSDTVAQIVVNYSTGLMWSRSAVLGTPTWTPWESHWTSGNLVKQTTTVDDTPGHILLTGAYGWGQGGIDVPTGTNLDTITAAGVYRLQTSPEYPEGINWSPMIVAVGQDTAFQLVVNNQTGVIYSRGYVASVGWGAWTTGWNNQNFDPNSKQNNLGFTPVQQGTGTGQVPNSVVKIGYRSDISDAGLQIDVDDYGAIWTDNNGIGKVAWATSTFGAGNVGSYGIFRVSGGGAVIPGTEVAGVNLTYTDTGGQSSHSNPAGTWRLMGGLSNADGAGSDSVSLYLRVI